MRIATIAQLLLCFVVGKDLGKDTDPIYLYICHNREKEYSKRTIDDCCC